MKKLPACLLVCIHIVIASALSASLAADGTNISKKYHITKPAGQNVDISVRVTEASGLALSHAGKALWTVSDNKKNLVFKMNLHGKPKNSESFAIVNYPFNRPDIEGVCLSDDSKFMYLVQEREMAIIKINVTPGSTRAAMVMPPAQLSSMKNYSTKVLPYLKKNDNSGLEGITFHGGTKDIFVLLEKVEKDGKKGPLVIQVNNDLNTIVEAKFLSGDRGFVGINNDTKIDGSGIDFDRTSENSFYIVSNEGRRLFHYDWKNNTATPKIDLPYAHAEGVVYDTDKKKFYIVTDGGKNADSRLYTYDNK
jgi:uncharacterized protein YjiK